MPPRVVAVDWSGAKKGARRKIWLAEVAEGRLRRLESGRGRSEIVQHLIAEAEEDPHLVVGLDFAFSFPRWFLDEHGLESGPEVWDRVADSGEEWLLAAAPPFWGRPGSTRPDLPSQFRRTELEVQEAVGSRPKSVFQIGGAGAVGTGSLRGMPHLAELRDAGFSVWPFHEPGWPLVLEIYPRLLTGGVVKSDPSARNAYLRDAFPEIPPELEGVAAASEDALDAAISAVVMARHLDEIEGLERPDDPVLRKEGAIWYPSRVRGVGTRTSGRPGSATSTAPGQSKPTAGASRDDCPFCDIDPEEIVAESEHGVAFRDAFPVSEGHTLIIPREHGESLFDLSASVQRDLWSLVSGVRAKLAEELDVDAFNIGLNDGALAGQTISHAHIHVIPRREGDVADPRGGIRWVRPDRAAYWDR